MGYYASGNGSAKLKKDTNIEELRKIIDTMKKNDKISYELEYDMDETSIDFWESDGHYDEEETETFLNTLIPFITSGSFCFRGDEDAIWRYTFDPERSEWKEEDGIVTYNDAELIAELEKKGYTVTKKQE